MNLPCSCIRADGYQIYVDAIDRQTIVYEDLSDWMDEENYFTPEDYRITVTPPATSSSYQLNVRTIGLNKILPSNLGGKIKDGVYSFNLQSCGNSLTRNVALFPHMECCIEQAWATLEKQFYPRIREVEQYLKLAQINAELNKTQTASDNLKVAKKLLDNLNCNCDC